MRFLLSAFILLISLSAAAEEIIDLQWSICETSTIEVLKKLEQDLTPTKVSQEVFWDTIPVSYINKGISFRLKETNDELESSIKIRFDYKNSNMDAFDCSWDRYGNNRIYTCELASSIDNIKNPFNREQKKLIKQFETVDWNSLKLFGPFPNPKWKFKIGQYKATFDSLDVESHFQIMELSVKVPLSSEKNAYNLISNYLKSHKVQLCEIQEGKTHKYLRFYGL